MRYYLHVRFLLGLALLILGSSCGGDAGTVAVDLQTDYRPETEFVEVSVELARVPFEEPDPDATEARAVADTAFDYLRGRRVAEFGDVEPGRVYVRVTLFDRAEFIVARRTVELDFAESFALLVTLTRDCAGRACPGPGDGAGLTECLSGRCVEPGCTVTTESACGQPLCTTDAECSVGAGCAAASCISGACLCKEPDDLPDAGPRDAGVPDASMPIDGGPPPPPDGGPVDASGCGPSPACTPGQTDRGGACGRCGTEVRTCQGDCTWGAFTCTDEGACSPGATDSGGSCGRCGTEVRTCQSDCTWGGFACTGEGVCTPGATDSASRSCGNCSSGTQTRTRTCTSSCTWGAYGAWGTCTGATGCAPGATRGCPNGDSCGHEVCSSSCTWSSCQPTVQCLRIRPGTSGPEGNNWRCCGPNSWQFCLSTCRWSTACSSGCGCGC
jgi:hypothetical protein